MLVAMGQNDSLKTKVTNVFRLVDATIYRTAKHRRGIAARLPQDTMDADLTKCYMLQRSVCGTYNIAYHEGFPAAAGPHHLCQRGIRQLTEDTNCQGVASALHAALEHMLAVGMHYRPTRMHLAYGKQRVLRPEFGLPAISGLPAVSQKQH